MIDTKKLNKPLSLAEIKARDIIYKMKQYRIIFDPMEDVRSELKTDKSSSKRQALVCANFIIDATKTVKNKGVFKIKTEVVFDPFWIEVRDIINNYNFDLL